jgi:hypothetical protein
MEGKMNTEELFKEALKNHDKMKADELIEQISNPDLLWEYIETFKQRLPESREKFLLRSAHDVWRYINELIQDRFPEYEDIIEMDPYVYILYTNFLKKINKYDEFLKDRFKDKPKKEVSIEDLLKNPGKVKDVFREIVEKEKDKKLADILLPYVDPFYYHIYLKTFSERVPLELERNLFRTNLLNTYLDVIIDKGLFDSFLKDWGDKYVDEIVDALGYLLGISPLIEVAVRTDKDWANQVVLPLLNYDFDRTSEEWGKLLTLLFSSYDFKLPSKILSKLGEDDLEGLKKILDNYEGIVRDREGDTFAEDSFGLIERAYEILKNRLTK